MKALISKEIARDFELKTGISTIPLSPYDKLDAPVSSHADMLFCILDNTIFCYEDYVKNNGLLDCLKNTGYNIIFVYSRFKTVSHYDTYLFYFVIRNIEGIRFLCYENLLPHTIHIHMNDTSTKPFYYYRQ